MDSSGSWVAVFFSHDSFKHQRFKSVPSNSLFCSLYLIAIGQGGYKPCIKVFGADQFDGNDLKEEKAKSSYFNWFMFESCASILTTCLVSSYIQEYLSWSLGFGIPSVSMLLALLLFLLGTKTYCFSTARRGKINPFARISRVFMEALNNRRQQNLDIYNPNETLLPLAGQSSKQFRFLDKAAISCSLAEIKEAFDISIFMAHREDTDSL